MAKLSTKPEPLVKLEPKDGEELGKLWHARLEQALRYRKNLRNADKQWERASQLDRGDHWNNGQQAGETGKKSDNLAQNVTVNLIGSYARDFLAFLFKNVPKFLASPRKPESIASAKLQQELVNYYWRELGWRKQARKSVRDMIVLGTGIARTGWVLELDQAVKPDADGKISYDDAIRVDFPFVRRVSPARFIVDPAAEDLETARWVAETYRKPLADVLANSKYSEKVRREIREGKLKPALFGANENVRKDSSDTIPALVMPVGEQELQDHVRLYEVFDKKFDRHVFLLEGIDEPLLVEGNPFPYLDGFPYVFGVYDEFNDELYGQGLPAVLEDQQLELNAIRTGQFQHRRRYSEVLLQVAENALASGQLAALQNGTHRGTVLVKEMDAIKAVQQPQLPTDGQQIEASIMEDMRNLSGGDQLTSGANLPSRTSATEVNARAGYTGMKIEMRVDVVDSFLAAITRQVLQHARAQLTKAQAFRIQGTAGQEWAEVANRDEIRDEVDLEITTVSAERKDEASEKAAASNVAQILLQNQLVLQQAGQMLNTPRLFKWWLGDVFGVKEYDEFVLPLAPDPNAVDPATGQPVSTAQPQIPGAQLSAQIAAAPPQNAELGAMLGGA